MAARSGCNVLSWARLRLPFKDSVELPLWRRLKSLQICASAYLGARAASLEPDENGRLRAKIADFRPLEKSLATISSNCEAGDLPDCPIIEALLADQH